MFITAEDMSDIQIKLTRTTFWLKCINLSKCTKFCFKEKLEVADKYFGLFTKYYLMGWRGGGGGGGRSSESMDRLGVPFCLSKWYPKI